jgi:thioester reductase-like protein
LKDNKSLTVVIVGATGHFGRHILAHHIDTASASVTRITCPVRPSHLSRPHPYIRTLKSISSLQTYLN